MKDYALQLAAQETHTHAKLNILREYLQALILRTLHSQRFFEDAAFVGGTALRFLHNLPRYSEDLDFTLHSQTPPDWTALLKKIKAELDGSGYAVQFTYRDKPPIFSSQVKFSNLLLEAGISVHKNQILSIKLELDTHPPDGAILDTKFINRPFPLAFTTHDLSSLFAGKIHAMLARGFTKGRDFFDVGFYLSKWPGLQPNLPFLTNALQQTNWNGKFPTEKSWRSILVATIEKADWEKVEADLNNFLERPKDHLIFTKANLLRLTQGQT